MQRPAFAGVFVAVRRLGTLVTASVLALLLAPALAPPARANGTHSQHLDSFLCYQVKQKTKFTPVEDVHLVDQFEDVMVDVTETREFCNPAAPTLADIFNPDIHLRWYKIEPVDGSPPPVLATGIVVVNALGTLSVDTLEGDKLAVPAAKSLTSAPSAPTQTGLVNHYRCYDVAVSAGMSFPDDLQVTLEDQFTSPPKVFDVIRPEHLCVPVDKNGEGITPPADALLCYDVERASGQPKHKKRKGVYVTDQFEAARLDTKVEDEVCLRSSVTPSSTTTTTTTTSTTTTTMACKGDMPPEPCTANSECCLGCCTTLNMPPFVCRDPVVFGDLCGFGP